MSVDIEKLARKWSRDKKEEAQRRAGFWAGASAPVLAGRHGKGQHISPFQGVQFESVRDLTRNVRTGDVLLVADGKRPFSAKKALISIGTGIPDGYHAAVVAGVSKKKGEIEILDLTFKGYQRKAIAASNINSYSLFRISDPAKQKAVVDNMHRLVNTQKRLNAALKREGMSSRAIRKVNRAMYAETINPVIGVRELFVPYVQDRSVRNANYVKKVERELKFVSSNINGIAKDMVDYWKQTGKIDTSNLKPIQRVCTSVAASVGVPIGATSHPKWAGPNDILRGKGLRPIGYKVSPKHTNFVKLYDGLLKVMPNIVRGAAGVGLGGFVAGTIATRQALKRSAERREARKARAENRLKMKKRVHVKGHMRGRKYVKSHTKMAYVYERMSMDDLQDRAYAHGLSKSAAIMEIIKSKITE